jgi:hypothetical protein
VAPGEADPYLDRYLVSQNGLVNHSVVDVQLDGRVTATSDSHFELIVVLQITGNFFKNLRLTIDKNLCDVLRGLRMPF